MKIAVYFSGRVDGYEHTLDKLEKHFFSKYDCDFYWSLDHEQETEYHATLRQILHPKGVNFQVLDQKFIDVPLASTETFQRNSLSMFFHNMHCTNMIEEYCRLTNTVYDCIVRFRIDIDSDEDFVIPDVIMANTIYIPSGFNYRGICDRIAFGDYKSMMIYSNVYIHIHNYVYVRKAILNPEYLVMFHINENNMNVIRVNYRFRLHPFRLKVRRVDEEDYNIMRLSDASTYHESMQDDLGR